MLFDSIKSIYKFLKNKYHFSQDDILDAVVIENNFDITLRIKSSVFKLKKKIVFSGQKEDIKLASQVNLVLS